MASSGETCRNVADADPITGSWSTVYFVFKYSKDLLIKPGITDTDMQDKITSWATSMTSITYNWKDKESKRMRFVGIVEEVAKCQVSFHQTTQQDKDINIIDLAKHPAAAMMISIRGPICQDSSKKTDENSLTYGQLYTIYTNLLTTLTDPLPKNGCNLDIQSIFIERIEMVPSDSDEVTLINELTMGHKPDQTNIERELMQTKQEVERLREDQKVLKRQIEQLQSKLRDTCKEIVSDEDENPEQYF